MHENKLFTSKMVVMNNIYVFLQYKYASFHYTSNSEHKMKSPYVGTAPIYKVAPLQLPAIIPCFHAEHSLLNF